MKQIILYIFILVFGLTTSPSFGDELLTVRFMDVGYADAILVEFPGGTNGLIDTGSPESAPKIIETLKQHDIQELAFVVLTHSHINHFGGLEAMIDHIEIAQVYINDGTGEGDEGYIELLATLEKHSIPVEVLKYKQQISIDGSATKLQVVHPPQLTGSHNADSLSFLLTHAQTRFWLTADIQPEGQDQIINAFPEVLQADCVQVPHHGGQLSKQFKSMRADQIFVVSTGENIYGKPMADQLAVLPGWVLRTDQSGDIVIRSDGQSIEVVHE